MMLKQLAKKLYRLYRNRPIKNVFQTQYTQRALLSYINKPFTRFLNSKTVTHTNNFEAFSWAKALDALHYQVDVVPYNQSPNINWKKYDVLCGFGDSFTNYFKTSKKNLKTIYYGTGMHVCHNNNATLARLKQVYKQKGVWLTESARYVPKTWTYQTSLVDAMILLGNEVCKKSYSKYYDGKIFTLPSPFYKTLDGEAILKNRKLKSPRHFLWFGSRGLIHKGLDLCLDFFSKNPHLTLHVCGPIHKEPNFANVYHKELYELKNIKTHGFVDIQSKVFEHILQKCDFLIYPSCSEGGSPSVVTAVGNGALIPLITKETTISTGFEILIDSLDQTGINKAVKQALALSNSELYLTQKNNLNYTLRTHTQDAYYRNLKQALKTIIND